MKALLFPKNNLLSFFRPDLVLHHFKHQKLMQSYIKIYCLVIIDNTYGYETHKFLIFSTNNIII